MSLLDFFGVTEQRQSLAPAVTDDRYYETISPKTTSGIRVDENTAFNYSVCWAATRLLAGTAGWLPFNLYKRLPSGGANIDSGHRVHRLIHDQPNRDMASMMFRAQGVNHQVNWGNCFAEITRNQGGMVQSLEVIHPRRIPVQNIKREGSEIVYYVNRPDGVGRPQRVAQEDMFHVPSIISEEGIIGKGVVTAARESIGKAIGTQRRGAAANNNGGAPPLGLKKAVKFKDKAEREEYRRQLAEIHSGPENAGKWLLMDKDDAVEKLGFSLEDSQFIESEQFDIEEMARWYGVPPHLVGHLLRATFNNIEELGISFVKYSLIQWLKLWEQEVWRKLLNPQEQETHYAKFVVDALERGNLATRTEAGVKKFFNGLWTLNQWAEQEDMNPITETTVIDGQTVSLGDLHFVQQAMIPLAQAAKGPPETQPAPQSAPPPDNQPNAGTEAMQAQITAVTAGTSTLAASVERIVVAVGLLQSDNGKLGESLKETQTTVLKLSESVLQSAASAESRHAELTGQLDSISSGSAAIHGKLSQALVRDVLARLLSVEIHNVKQASQTSKCFIQRLEAFYDSHRLAMERQLQAPIEAAMIAAGRTDDPLPVVRQHIDGHVTSSMQSLLGVCECQADELPGKVEECVSKWHEERVTVTL